MSNEIIQDCVDNTLSDDEPMTYDDELFFWKSRAIQLETDYNDLLSLYEKTKAIKLQLEQHILQNDEQPKKNKGKRKVSQYQQDFNIFFDRKKHDQEFVASIKNKLLSLEIITSNEKVPWYILRNECKKQFEKEKHQNNQS
jgi:hypothetical protein